MLSITHGLREANVKTEHMTQSLSENQQRSRVSLGIFTDVELVNLPRHLTLQELQFTPVGNSNCLNCWVLEYFSGIVGRRTNLYQR